VIFGTCKLHKTSGAMQILANFVIINTTCYMEPHTINKTATYRQLGKKSYVKLLQIIHLL